MKAPSVLSEGASRPRAGFHPAMEPPHRRQALSQKEKRLFLLTFSQYCLKYIMTYFNSLKDDKEMKAIVTVIGKDKSGIIAEVCTLLANSKVNILDISQTVMQGFFTMTMLIDLTESTKDFAVLSDELKAKGEEMGLNIRMQREDIFDLMHRV